MGLLGSLPGSSWRARHRLWAVCCCCSWGSSGRVTGPGVGCRLLVPVVGGGMAIGCSWGGLPDPLTGLEREGYRPRCRLQAACPCPRWATSRCRRPWAGTSSGVRSTSCPGSLPTVSRCPCGPTAGAGSPPWRGAGGGPARGDKSPLSAAKHIVKVDGRAGLFKGLAPRLCSSAIGTVVHGRVLQVAGVGTHSAAGLAGLAPGHRAWLFWHWRGLPCAPRPL